MLADARAHTMTCSDSDFCVQINLGSGRVVFWLQNSIRTQLECCGESKDGTPSPAHTSSGFFSEGSGGHDQVYMEAPLACQNVMVQHGFFLIKSLFGCFHFDRVDYPNYCIVIPSQIVLNA